MKKLILILLMILFSLAGCQSVPFTYDALEGEIDAARESGDTKRITKAEERLDRYEATAERAAAYFENRAACMASGEHVWFCNGGERHKDDDQYILTDDLVRAYRRDRGNCQCGTTQSVIDALRGY